MEAIKGRGGDDYGAEVESGDDEESPPFIFDILGVRGVAAFQVVSGLEIAEEGRSLWLGGLGILGDKVSMELFTREDISSLGYAPIDVVYALWKIFRTPPEGGEPRRSQYSRVSLLKEVAIMLRESASDLDFSEGAATQPIPRFVMSPIVGNGEFGDPIDPIDTVIDPRGKTVKVIFSKPKKVSE